MSQRSYHRKCKRTGEPYVSDTIIWYPPKPHTRHQKHLWRRSVSQRMRQAFARAHAAPRNSMDHWVMLITPPWRELGLYVHPNVFALWNTLHEKENAHG